MNQEDDLARDLIVDFMTKRGHSKEQAVRFQEGLKGFVKAFIRYSKANSEIASMRVIFDDPKTP